jgi:hypothetical protein
MRQIIVYKASVLTFEIRELVARKLDDEFVYWKGDRDRINNGYVAFFVSIEEARDWLVTQHNKWDHHEKITKENIHEYQDKEISDKERATGKLERNEKGRTARTVSKGKGRRSRP